jgi:hypothetical protein
MGGDDRDDFEDEDEDDDDDNVVDSANKGRLRSLFSLKIYFRSVAFSRLHNSGLIFD